MYCRECGKKLEENAKYCTECGKRTKSGCWRKRRKEFLKKVTGQTAAAFVLEAAGVLIFIYIWIKMYCGAGSPDQILWIGKRDELYWITGMFLLGISCFLFRNMEKENQMLHGIRLAGYIICCIVLIIYGCEIPGFQGRFSICNKSKKKVVFFSFFLYIT